MKKKLLLLLVGIVATSCNTSYNVVSQTRNYTESITYTIDKVVEGKTIATGNGSFNATRGNKFVFVYLTFSNKLDQKQDLNFDNFNLLNERTKTKHKAEWAMVVSPVNLFGKIDSHIGKGDEKKRKLVFVFPEQDKANLLMVNDEIVDIEYAQ